MIEKLKKSKAGFTLVELIVVIAIIGVLAAVLVPQYIKYIETSREGTDLNAIGELYHAVEIAAAATGKTGTVAVTAADGTLKYTDSASLGSELSDIVTNGEYAMKSTKGKAFTGTITITTTGVSWTAGGLTADGKFS